MASAVSALVLLSHLTPVPAIHCLMCASYNGQSVVNNHLTAITQVLTLPARLAW